jgi:hypothetical protein
MKHIGYCTNIHPGVSWEEHFNILKESIPQIKKEVSPAAPLGLGLRLSHEASLSIDVRAFRAWLEEVGTYVFTMNGFPYGEFHGNVVKDQVHAPDWTTVARRDYTVRLFTLLAELLPDNMASGGVSTSPLSYRYWWEGEEALNAATAKATEHILDVVEALGGLKERTGKSLHLDIEPEPDGILENSTEFIDWYLEVLVPAAIRRWEDGEERVREHVQLCFDVCHFAVAFEEPVEVVNALALAGIRTGKIQVSSALQVDLRTEAKEKLEVLKRFNEPVYLHQVVARRLDGGFEAYRDLGAAIEAFRPDVFAEWRIHYHVPLFTEDYALLKSTQAEIVKTFSVLGETNFTDQLEIETYTWGVLPEALQAPLNESIIREIGWVKRQLLLI